MNIKLLTGFIVSLFLVATTCLIVDVRQVLAEGTVLITGSKLPSGRSWCPGCNVLEQNNPALYKGVQKIFINNDADEYAKNGVDTVPSLKLGDGTVIASNDPRFMDELQKAQTPSEE